MDRRDFIKIGISGLAAIAVGNVKIPHLFRTEAFAANLTIDLSMEAALVEMVDGTQVFHWLFKSPLTVPDLPSFPGPAIFATAGDDITINIKNNLKEPHAFQIVGTRVLTPPISPGQTRTVRFTAPAAGTYLYIDPLNDPVNRVLGLHGAFIVSPVAGNTPYSSPTPAVQQLFNDLGTTPQFPRHALSPAGWDPTRFRIWLHHQIDPAFNAQAQADFEAGRPSTVSAADMRASFLARYFTINGKTGVFASHDHATTIEGRIGQPMLVRILNAGLFTHSNHIHANHIYVTSVNNAVQDNVIFIDSLAIKPLDRIDWVVPFIRPPDIAGDPNTQLRDLIPEELALTIPGAQGSPGVPQSPLPYPMHCHMEPSQTAAGGNYPQGSITHFDFLGDVDGVDFPNVH
ncbi:MAG: multicopper oxidase domain-containing protein [Geobacteraceae bacterium]|nr:multicopper oxidase domain-containing protein [Geobacteraceae bacterium]